MYIYYSGIIFRSCRTNCTGAYVCTCVHSFCIVFEIRLKQFPRRLSGRKLNFRYLKRMMDISRVSPCVFFGGIADQGSYSFIVRAIKISSPVNK